MRVGLFSDTYTPEINGVVTSIVTLQKELEKHGHTVFVITTANSALHVQKDGNILRMPGVEIKKLYGYRLASPFHVIGLNDVKQMKLDVIHAHTEFGIGIFARIVGKILSIPIVATYHTMYEDYTHYINFLQSRTVDKGLKKVVSSLSRLYGDTCSELIAPSQKTRAMLAHYGIKKEIHVIPTGLQLARFQESEESRPYTLYLRTHLGLLPGESMMLFVGRIAQEKSIDLLLHALAALKKENAFVKLVIVGDGPYLDTLKQLAIELTIESSVVFVGKIQTSEIPKYYLASDFFVSASLSETQGLTFIEAMAGGSVVFAKEKEIMESLILEGENGYYFDNESDLKDKILSFLALPPQEILLMKEKAREAVVVLDSTYFYQNIMKVYESAVYRHRSLFKIKSYKSKQGNFEVVFESDVETLKYMISMDTFYRHRLEEELQIGPEILAVCKEEDDWIRAYLAVIRYLASKDRTRKEMYDYLSHKSELPIGKINDMIQKLEDLNYINDDLYVKSQIDRMKLMFSGKKKILQTLVKKGIPYEKAKEALDQVDDSVEMMSAIKLIEKSLPLIRGKNEKTMRISLFNTLLRQGFPKDTIEDAMALVTIEKNEDEEERLLVKECQKQRVKWSKKYDGKELEQRLIQSLLRKGYSYQHIQRVVEEGEFHEINQ